MQSKENLMGQSNEIKKNCKGPRNFDVSLCVIFSYYNKSHFSGRYTKG